MPYLDLAALDELARRLVFAREAALAIKAKKLPQDSVDLNWLLFVDPELTTKLDPVIDIRTIEAFDSAIEQTKLELGKTLRSLKLNVLLSGDTRADMIENMADRFRTSSELRATKPAKPRSGSTDPRGPPAEATVVKHFYGLTGRLQDLQPYFQQRVLYLALGRLMVELLAAPPTTGISDRVTKDRDKHSDDARKRLALVVAALAETSGSTAGTTAQILIDKPHGLTGTQPKSRAVANKDTGTANDHQVPDAASESSGTVAGHQKVADDALDETSSEPHQREDDRLNPGDGNEDTEQQRNRAGANNEPSSEIDHSVGDAVAGSSDDVAAADSAFPQGASDGTTSESPRSEDRVSRPRAVNATIEWEKVILARLGVHQDGVPSNAGSLVVPAIEAARFFTGASNATENGSDARRWTLAHIMKVLELPSVEIAVRGITTPEPEHGFFDVLFKWKLAAQQATVARSEAEKLDQWISLLHLPENWKRFVQILKWRRDAWGYGPFHEQLMKKGWRPLSFSWDPWIGYSPKQLRRAIHALGLADFSAATDGGRRPDNVPKYTFEEGSFYTNFLKHESKFSIGSTFWLSAHQDYFSSHPSADLNILPSDTLIDAALVNGARRRWIEQLDPKNAPAAL